VSQSSETFPTLQDLGIPVEYNFAGVPYVPWGVLGTRLRSLGWEQLFTDKVGSMGALEQGPYAYEVEEMLALFRERSRV